jgi:hypothetical protein
MSANLGLKSKPRQYIHILLDRRIRAHDTWDVNLLKKAPTFPSARRICDAFRCISTSQGYDAREPQIAGSSAPDHNTMYC